MFVRAWSFYVRNPRYSLLAREGSAGLRSHGTHRRLSDKGTVNAGRDSCARRSKHFKFTCCFVLFLSGILLFVSFIFNDIKNASRILNFFVVEDT